MILSDDLCSYLDSLSSGNDNSLDMLEKQALSEGVPVIGAQVQDFLKVLLAVIKPVRILEIGTGVGFSALLMAANTDSSCRIDTIENYPKRIAAAKENLARYDSHGRITLLEGDAQEILPALAGPYDFIFLDAAKGQYLNFLPGLLRLLRPGGVLAADDVLQDGSVSGSRLDVAQRKRTIYSRIRDFLDLLTHTDGLLTSVMPLGDGVSVTVKQKEKIDLETA